MKASSTRVLFTLLFAFLFSVQSSYAQCDAAEVVITDYGPLTCIAPKQHMVFGTTINYMNKEAVKIYDYTLPTGLTGKVKMAAKGGNGGKASIYCYSNTDQPGGIGAYLLGTVTVGTDSGLIPPGSTIRYVIGEAGKESIDFYTGDTYVRGGSGGGSTAVLFKAPGSTNWQVLMVAGAGGGASVECRHQVSFGFLVTWLNNEKAGGNGTMPSASQWYGNGGVSAYNHAAGGGGGMNTNGQDAPMCLSGCVGGQSGSHWLTDDIHNPHRMYAASGVICIGLQSRLGGRGFTGGGAGVSNEGYAGGGGGGGIAGGASGGREADSLGASQGGASAANSMYVTLTEAKTDTTAYANGYADFEFIPDAISAAMTARIDLLPTAPAPYCDSATVTYKARAVYSDGRSVNGLINVNSSTPVYRWSINGVQMATGQTYADSTFSIKYVPGNIISCQFWAKDTNSCGTISTPIASVTLPNRNQPAAVSELTITAVPGTTVCEKRVYDQFGGYNLEAWATYKATTNFLPKPYVAGNGNYMYLDSSFTAQQIALQACEAEYGVGNCTLGSSMYYCLPRPILNTIDSLYSGLISNTNLDSTYYYVPQPAPISVTSTMCNGYSYYYRTGISQTTPDANSHQFVFAASTDIKWVNEDFSNGIIADSGSLIFSNNTIQFNQRDTMIYPSRYGVSTTGKFPFVRTYINKRWVLGEANLGSNVYTGNVAYTPIYNWFRNGYVQGTGHSYTDGNGVVHLDTIPFTADTLWVRNVGEGEVITCKVSNNHCPTPYYSNTLTMHVQQPSIGGALSGPEHPCPNAQVTYKVSGAQNAISYVWIIDGPAYNMTSTDTTRTFYIGEDTVRITCMPIGPCGSGDTLHYVVAPGTVTNQPCNSMQLIVNTNGVRCEGIPTPSTISVYGVGECYLWSNGAKTPTITVFEDGNYFVYVNGCKSQEVTLTSQSGQHPTVSIAINAIQPGQEEAWCRNNNYRSISATVANYIGNPNVNYQWYRNGIPYSTQNGGLYLNLNTLNSYDTIQCRITLDEQCALPVWSNKIVLPEISGNEPLGLGVSISAPQGCSGDTVTFTALPLNAGSNPTYTWRVNSTFASDTDAVYQRAWNNVTYEQIHTVYLTVFASPLTCRTGGNVKQIVFNYTVYPKVTPVVNISAENTAICPGDSITFNATAENGGASPIYQWYNNNVAVGTNTASYTAGGLANGDSVYCIYANTDNTYCIAAPDKSNVLAAKVYTPLLPTITASASEICLDNSTNVSATLNPQSGDYNYEGFGGIFAPSQWTINRGCMGEINTTQAPTVVDISVQHPPYGPSFTTCNNEMLITMPYSGTVSFDWAYRLISSSSAEDVPLVFIDGTEYRFPEIDYTLPQYASKSGHFSVSVQQGQVLTLRQKGVIYETANQSQYMGSATTFFNFKLQTQPAIKWYDAAQNGNLIGTTNTIAVTPTAAGVTYYYAEAANTDAGCGMRSLVAVIARPPSTTVKTMATCESYTWLNGVTYTASTNTPTYTLTDQLGCDSILNLNLIILQPTTATATVTACGSYTWIDGVTYTTNNNTATHIIANSVGCDSVITLNLTIKAPTSSTNVVSACESYTWIDGNTYTASNSTATHTLTAINGCDSVVTLNLTIKNPTATTDVVSACESYTWINGTTYTASNNTATYIVTGSNGCDSVTTLNLTINTPTTSTDVVSACQSYTWIDGATYTASNNTATYTVSGSNGCDSVVMLNLTIGQTTANSITQSICAGDSYNFNGTTVSNAGIYTDTLTSNNSCDSIVILTLNVWSLPTQPVITQVDDTLICTPATNNYNWYRNGNAVGSLFNNSPLAVNQLGNYEVEVIDSNGCTSRSAVYQVVSVGIKDLAMPYDVKLFPNPNKGTFSIAFSDVANREVCITDMAGRLVMAGIKVSGQHTIDIDVAAGMYILSVNQAGIIRNIRFSVLE